MAAGLSNEAGGGTVREGSIFQKQEAISMGFRLERMLQSGSPTLRM